MSAANEEAVRLRAPEHCPIPQWYYIDIGNACNLRCPFCATGNGQVPAADKGLMTKEDFDVISDKLRPYAHFVCLFNWGEPFLNKHLLYMTRKLADDGVRVHLDSNLTLRDFDAAECEAIVTSGLDSLFASIDGVTQESYQHYRVDGDVERALSNLRKLAETRDRLGRDRPGLVWAFYLNRHNEHEVDAARELAADIGVPIWFKQLSCPDDFQTSLIEANPAVFTPPEGLSQFNVPQLNAGLPGFELHPALPGVCRQPFTIGVVHWNGAISPCCAMAGKQFYLGNLLESEPEEIWNGEPLRACRRFLSGYGPPQNGSSVCETHCPAVAPSLP